MQIFRDFYEKTVVDENRFSRTGTFLGVFLPSLFTMIGAFLYVPIAAMLGQFGLIYVIALLGFSTIVTLVTALSLSATASNMHVGDGGSYFMISRSFGLKTGAVMGFALYIAHTLMACLCVFGFSESMLGFFPNISLTTRSILTLLGISLLSCVSQAMAMRAQIVIFILVLCSLFWLFQGEYQGEGIEGSFFKQPFSFWAAFALFYPALIGIEAGAALSGDLKRPRFSLIVGTIGSALIGFFFYLTVILVLWKRVPTIYLKTDSEVVKHFLNYPIGFIGFWAATLASALGCLLSAPRTLRAMGQDQMLPRGLKPFGTSIQAATIFTALVACLACYFGSIGYIAPLLTMVILIVYGLLNLASGVEELIGNPSWRPTIRISPYISLFGAFLCFSSVILMDSSKAFMAFSVLTLMFFIVKKSVLESRLDDLRQTMLFSLARFAIYRLNFVQPSIRSWRPNFLVLSESAGSQSDLLRFTSEIAKDRGFVTLASVLKNAYAEVDEVEKWEMVIRQNLKKKSLEALVEVTIAENLAEGLKNIVANYGLGPLVPNTVVLGQCNREELFDNYMQILKIASESKRNVVIFRNSGEAKEKQEIDIWWDEHQKGHTDLMIILATLLQREKSWRKAHITLKSVVLNESAVVSQAIYFQEFFRSSRLNMRYEIYLKDAEVREMIKRHSTRKGIVFVGMKELQKEYYKKIVSDFQDIPTICFVANCGGIDLHTLLT